MRQYALTAVALLLGALVTFLVARALGLAGLGGVSTAMVVVTTANIAAGQSIDSTQVKEVAWPQANVPPGSFDRAKALYGRVAKQTLFTGEPVLEARLAAQDARGGLSAIIETGKRAISVRVNDVVGVAGFALPGSLVDVLVSAKDESQHPFSTTVLTRVKVLAVAQETQADPNKPKVVNAVTLELTSLEAEKLDLARSIGTLSLVLRNDSDNLPVDSSGTRLTHILQAGATPPEKQQAQAASPAPASKPSKMSEGEGVISIRGITKRQENP